MTETPVIEVTSVSKAFGEVLAVDDVSLQLYAGQTLGLIGPNGAGKTTLLRIIATLTKPDRGDVRILGESVSQPRNVRRSLGFMPAEFGFPASLTIGEYLDYFGKMYGIDRSARGQRIGDVCELTDLSGRQDVMVKGLSTGNRQRLLLAKTLMHDPQLLVLDEPASGLDPRARAELRGILKALASMGKAILVSSHILPDIEDISDRIGILEAGRLVLDGDLNDLRQQVTAGHRVVRLQVPPGDVERAIMAIRQLSAVMKCDQRGEFVIVQMSETDGNAILATVLQMNIPVIQFAASETSLEEIFLRSTVGRVT